MASGGDTGSFHDKSEVLHYITPCDRGPLNELARGQQVIDSFRAGTYYVTTPKEDVVPLYRLYGGRASEAGQYWSFGNHRGNESYRHDMAVERNWGNSLAHEAFLLVPKGTVLFEGMAAPQRQYFGGGWQVFIPRDVVKPLMENQRLIFSGNSDKRQQETLVKKAQDAQNNIMKTWEEKYSKSLISNGNNIPNLRSDVRGALAQSGSGSVRVTNGVQPTGTFTIHKQRIPLPGGGHRNKSVSVTIELDHSETRTYTSGRTVITETTNYYNMTITTTYG